MIIINTTHSADLEGNHMAETSDPQHLSISGSQYNRADILPNLTISLVVGGIEGPTLGSFESFAIYFPCDRKANSDTEH